MTEIILRRVGLALVPQDVESIDAVSAIPCGAEVMVKVRRPRNPRHHRLFRALLSKVVEAGAPFRNADALLAFIKVGLGRYDSVLGPSGQIIAMPHSTSFESMGQDEFRRFFEEAVDLICTEIMPGLPVADLVNEIRDMLAPNQFEEVR